MTFGEEWGWGADKATSRAIFTRFVEHGGNFIDTANNYTKGTSESWLGEFIRGNRDRFVIGTKYSLSTRADDPNAGGNHRKNLVRSLEASLRRLRTDYVDLYWLHVWDSLTPVDEVLRALDDVVRAGKCCTWEFPMSLPGSSRTPTESRNSAAGRRSSASGRIQPRAP
jgi:aryl-alcohol dehydrogenase-like predicted oxidoreductase